MEEKKQVFITGLYSNDVADTAPEWILGKGSIHVEKLQTWLDTNKNLADENGYIRYVIKRAKDGVKRYAEVDFFKPKPKEQKETSYEDLMQQNHTAPDGTPYPMDENGAVKAIYDSQQVNPEDIPF